MSTATPDWQARIVPFWPTIIMRRTLDEHSHNNPKLTNVIDILNRQTEQLTTAYQGADLLSIDDDSIRWLKLNIDKSVRLYLDHQGLDYAIDWSLQAWANVNKFGDYHAPHNHGWCYLSGTYYVKMPQTSAGTSNAISFYDPRGCVDMLPSSNDDSQSSEQVFRPAPGSLLLWHSALQHLVHPNLTHETRITVSFNVVLDWHNHYVEQ